MKFATTGRFERPAASARDQAFLEADRWDDFTFKTLWGLTYVDADGVIHDIGGVKIGQFGLESGSPQVKKTFTILPKDFFSLGQDENYYLRLQQLGDAIRAEILAGLRDIAANLSLFERALAESVTQASLMRGASESTVRNQFHRMARWGAPIALLV